MLGLTKDDFRLKAENFDLTNGNNILRIIAGAFMFPHVAGKFASIGTLTLKAGTVGFFAKAGMTPEAPGVRGSSLTPPAPRTTGAPASMNPQRMQSLAPGLFGELEELRREVARLKSENESLRVASFTKRSE